MPLINKTQIIRPGRPRLSVCLPQLLFCIACGLTVWSLQSPVSMHAEEGALDLQAAIDSAQPGDVIVVPAGHYAGPLLIDKPVVLEGKGQPIIEGNGRGDVVTIEVPNVTVRGFVIRNSGDSLDQENAGVTGLAPNLTIENNRFEDTLFGIYLKEAPHSIVRGNTVLSKDLQVQRRGDGIRAWYSANSTIEDNFVTGSRDLVIWFSPDSIVRRNIVEHGRYGLHFMFSDNQLLEDNILRHNSVGAFLMYGRGLTMRRNVMHDNRGPSGYGVGLKDVDNIVAEGNRMVANRVGLYVDNSPREMDASVRFNNNVIAYNDTGAKLLPLVKRNTYVENVFIDNGEQIGIVGSGQLSDNDWSQLERGNYWSDYAGYDADGDRVGDVPYQPHSLYEDLLAAYPELRIYQQSPVADALDFATKAFPIFQPAPKISDNHPLTAVPSLPSVGGLPVAPVGPNIAVAAGMIVMALAVMWLGVGTPRFRRRA